MSRKISGTLTLKIPWKFMAGLRDKIIHGYFAINYDIVWDVVSRKIPELEPEIRAICDEQEPDEQGIARR